MPYPYGSEAVQIQQNKNGTTVSTGKETTTMGKHPAGNAVHTYAIKHPTLLSFHERDIWLYGNRRAYMPDFRESHNGKMHI